MAAVAQSQRPSKRSWGIWLGILGIAFSLPLVLLVLLFVLLPACQIGRVFSIPADSMSPTIKKGDRIYVSQSMYWFTTPHRGDLVVFWTKNIAGFEKRGGDTNTTFVKRLGGFPGESLSLHAGRLWVNGAPAPELAQFKYESTEDWLGHEGDSFIVSADGYFVLGDNSANSMDSRYWGCVPAANIRGCAFACLWPPQRLGFIR